MNRDSSELNLIAVQSCKGGVGKTTVAALLAAELARAGHEVCLLDLDFLAPGTATLLATDAPTPGIAEYMFGYGGEGPGQGKVVRARDVCQSTTVPWIGSGRVRVHLAAARPDMQIARAAQPYILADVLSGLLEARVEHLLLELRTAGMAEWSVLDVPPSFFGVAEAARRLVARSRGAMVHVVTPSRADLQGTARMYPQLIEEATEVEGADDSKSLRRVALLLNRYAPFGRVDGSKVDEVVASAFARGLAPRKKRSDAERPDEDLARLFVQGFGHVGLLPETEALARLSQIDMNPADPQPALLFEVPQCIAHLAEWSLAGVGDEL